MEAVVVDPGSHTIKAGYAAYNNPSQIEPSVVMPPCASETSGSGSVQSSEEDWCIRGAEVTDMERFEALMHNILYDQLGWAIGGEGNLLYAEPLFTSKAQKEDLCQLMFEVFNVSGLFFCDQAVLALYAYGKQTGCVVDIGHGKIDVATVTDGQLNNPTMQRLAFNGEAHETWLREILRDRGVNSLSQVELKSMKEKFATVAPSRAEFEDHQRKDGVQRHTLPDGQEIEIRGEGLSLGESLFYPQALAGEDSIGLAETVYNTITVNYETSLQKVLYDHLVVCGGGGNIPGVRERLAHESRLLSTPSVVPNVLSAPDYMPDHTQQYAAWVGGAILAKIAFPQNHHMSRAEYDERGPQGIHVKSG